MLGADPVVGCSGQRDHGQPPSIRSVGDRQDSVGSAGRGGSSPCAAAKPAVATTSFGPAKGSRSRRRSSQWTTFSKAAWPALGYAINRLNDSAVPALNDVDHPANATGNEPAVGCSTGGDGGLDVVRAGGLGERLTLVAIVAEQVALEAEFGEAGQHRQGAGPVVVVGRRHLQVDQRTVF